MVRVKNSKWFVCQNIDNEDASRLAPKSVKCQQSRKREMNHWERAPSVLQVSRSGELLATSASQSAYLPGFERGSGSTRRGGRRGSEDAARENSPRRCNLQLARIYIVVKGCPRCKTMVSALGITLTHVCAALLNICISRWYIKNTDFEGHQTVERIYFAS